MNFLAHAYLSFNDASILAGNMVSDFIKGKAQFGFSGKIRQGIVLHRQIDDFTDTHPATKKAKEIFRPAYRLYSGAIVDVLYDHFLANDPAQFTEASLKSFAAATYQQLEENMSSLPPNFVVIFGYMKMQDWLFNYRSHEGIRKSLNGLVRRSSYLTEADTAYNLFLEHYVELNACYLNFFEDVKQFAKESLGRLD
jgi:acyl carrier protein phosphodiesterase